ncbi:MAG: hypothetical protein WCJ29_02475 [bacterium]
MEKMKLFSKNTVELEGAVNTWLRENHGKVEIVARLFSTDEISNCIVIFYKEVEPPKA